MRNIASPNRFLCGRAVLVAEHLRRPGQISVDPRTGRAITMARKHVLFWMSLRSVALVVAGIAVLVILFPHAL